MNLQEKIDELDWCEPFMVGKIGKMVRKAPPTNAFWDVWREHKDQIKKMGISLTKYNNQWQVNFWGDGPVSTPSESVEDAPTLDFSLLPALAKVKTIANDSKPVLGTVKQFQELYVKLAVYSLEKYMAVLLGHGTGVGKTYIALATAKERGRRVAIICPKSITSMWIRAAIFMGVEIYDVQGWEWVKTGKSKMGQWVDKSKKQFRFTLPDNVDLILDEAHRAKTHGTQNSRLVYAAKDNKIPLMLLSATLATDPTEMDASGYALGVHRGGKDYFDFMKGMRCVSGRFGYLFAGTKKDLQRLNKMIFPERGSRVRASDLGNAFPKTTIEAKAFDVSNAKEISSAYADLELEIQNLIIKEGNSNAKAHMLAAMTRARQRVELLKAPLIVDLAKYAIEEGNSVFVCVNFRETALFIQKQFKECGIIIGQQPDNERQGYMDAFNADRLPIVVGTVGAAGESISLHGTVGGRQRISYIMPCYEAVKFKQAIGRVWRANGNTSFQYIVFAANVDIEERTCEILTGKLESMDTIMDGDIDSTLSLIPKQIENS